MKHIKYFSTPPIEYHKIEPYIREIIISRKYTKGRFRDMLEYELQEYIGVDNVICTSSGTSALYIAMRVLRTIRKDERIAIPAFTWSSVPGACQAAGCIITWNDIDKETWLPHTISNNFDAVLGHDTFGNVDTNDYPEDRTIYDATHSLGAKGVGSRGTAEVFSLAATKPVTSGEGGAITTNDRDFARKCAELRDLCSRLPEMSCVLALESLSHLDDRIRDKKKISDCYRKHLPYQFQEIPHDSTHSKICFLCDNSGELIARAAAAGVELRKYYEPLRDLPVSRDVYDRIVCLPSWSGVGVTRAIDALK